MFILQPEQSSQLVTCVAYNSATDPECNSRLSPEQCRQVIGWSDWLKPEEGKTVASPNDGNEFDKMRSVVQYGIPIQEETTWLYDRLLGVVATVNQNSGWNFEIAGFFRPLNLLHYQGEREHFYNWHIDIVAGNESARKISVSVQLSQPNDYDGCDLEINNGDHILTTPRDHGAVVMFPSYMLHRVTPIRKGERWAVVGWVQGLKSFR
ncbi:MAG TPA: 2OG-Fe(II) oxygenase [Gammaproteobacteria bacterium]